MVHSFVSQSHMLFWEKFLLCKPILIFYQAELLLFKQKLKRSFYKIIKVFYSSKKIDLIKKLEILFLTTLERARYIGNKRKNH